MPSAFARIELEASSLATNYRSAAHRAVAARELAEVDIKELEKGGTSRSKIAICICQVGIAMAALQTDSARTAAADALRSLVSAMRTEPRAARGAADAAAAPRLPYWIGR